MVIGLAVEGGMLGLPSAEGIGTVAVVATFVYEWYVWYIARVALDTAGLAAVFIALLDFALGVVISQVAVSLY